MGSIHDLHDRNIYRYIVIPEMALHSMKPVDEYCITGEVITEFVFRKSVTKIWVVRLAAHVVHSFSQIGCKGTKKNGYMQEIFAKKTQPCGCALSGSPLPLYPTQAGGEFFPVLFMVQYARTAYAVTWTAFFRTGTVNIVMRAMGHGCIVFLFIVKNLSYMMRHFVPLL